MNTLISVPGILFVAALLSSCAREPPRCHYSQEPVAAASAGCLVISEGRMLVVKFPNGQVSPPGGKAEVGESARCAAIRETWEETGVAVDAGELVHVFDSGFHLYRCHAAGPWPELKTRMPEEISAAYFLPAARIGETDWRFPDDRGVYLQALQVSPRDH